MLTLLGTGDLVDVLGGSVVYEDQANSDGGGEYDVDPVTGEKSLRVSASTQGTYLGGKWTG